MKTDFIYEELKEMCPPSESEPPSQKSILREMRQLEIES